MVEAARGSGFNELADVIDALDNPAALTINQVMEKAPGLEWLHNVVNRKVLVHRLNDCGYVNTRNRGAKDGLWRIKGHRQTIFTRAELTKGEREDAAQALKDKLD